MARELTILERLRRGEEPSQRTAVEDTNLLGKSVQANVGRLLNARLEHAPAQPDYGVPAPSEIVYGYPSAVTRMQKHIKGLIDKYEPRLADVEVIHIESDERNQLTLQFQIQGRLCTSANSTWISFLTRFDPSGRISLRR
ncbi:MAG TPA: type VI secretion system baseplate subunit TssE [Planctomycetes bacterium]|nr:type VI secretion system baseplate subunit TssE [Planctomycetota bacterium]